MGGFVTRTMDMNGQGGFGGFVTCGTPNAGALLATNVANGNFDKFLKNGLAQVTKGPIAQAIPAPSFAGYFAGKVSDLLHSKARASIEQFGAPGAMNTLSPTGGLVGTLNNVPPNSKPKMAFAGAETTPTLWREVESLINAPSTLNPDEESDAFISNVVIEGFKDLYLAKYTLNKDLALGASILFRKKQYMNRANAWMDGHIWWDQSNGLWQVLIGAGGSATTKTVKMVDIIHHGFCDNEVVEKDRTYTVLSGTPNDGIVTEASALALPGADYTQTLTGVNHQQFMNHANVTTALTNKVFNGGGHAFFTCQPR
jgi:hypothetical protein